MDALSGTTTDAKVDSGYPLSWQLDRYVRDEMLLLAEGAVVVPHRASDLLQNCDLPPPLKVFPATAKGICDGEPVAGPPSPSPKQLLFLPKPADVIRRADVDTEADQGSGEEAHEHLLKALRLSQTRAREAERKAAALGEKNRQMASLLTEESLRLYAHRQWLRLMEMENAWLRRRKAGRQGPIRRGHAAVGPPGCVVLALCLVVAAGLGIVVVIGCRFTW